MQTDCVRSCEVDGVHERGTLGRQEPRKYPASTPQVAHESELQNKAFDASSRNGFRDHHPASSWRTPAISGPRGMTMNKPTDALAGPLHRVVM